MTRSFSLTQWLYHGNGKLKTGGAFKKRGFEKKASEENVYELLSGKIWFKERI